MKAPSDLITRLRRHLDTGWAVMVAAEFPLADESRSRMSVLDTAPNDPSEDPSEDRGEDGRDEEGAPDAGTAGVAALDGVAGVAGAGADARWPYPFVIGAVPSSLLATQFAVHLQAALDWRDWSAAQGVQLEWKVRLVSGTRQRMPVKALVPNIDVAAGIAGAGWPDRLAQARARAREVRALFPDVTDLRRVLVAVGPLSDVDFDIACRVATWFVAHRDPAARDTLGAPTMTARQVPVEGVHAKWLNAHHRLVRDLCGLDDLALAPPHPARVHFTYLDPAHRAAGGRWHDSHSVGDHDVVAYPPRVVLISENKDTAVGFPPVPAGIAVEGEGRGATTMASVPWVHTASTVIYWGDMDRAGLEILNEFRGAGIRVTSMLMDVPTYRRYARFGTNLDTRGRPLEIGTARPTPHLTVAERELYELLTSGTAPVLRVEQERIPLAAAVRELTAVLS